MIKKYLKDPLTTIAINTTIFILGCVFFGIIVFTAIIIDVTTTENPIRTEHLKQHEDDNEKYDKIIELLEGIEKKN